MYFLSVSENPLQGHIITESRAAQLNIELNIDVGAGYIRLYSKK